MIGIKLADRLTNIALKQLQESMEFKQPRLDQIKESEDMYNNKTEAPEKGRFNIPIPIMGGFIDASMSKVDDKPAVNYVGTEKADLIKAKRVNSLKDYDSGPNRAKWGLKDRLIKKLAHFSGRGIAVMYSESKPRYKNHFYPVDYYDFQCEPNGGAILDDHIYKGHNNILKSTWDLKDGVKQGYYDADQVDKLLSATSSEVARKEWFEKYKNKLNRLQSLGLDSSRYTYAGENYFAMTQWCMKHQGKEYYLLFDPVTGVWVRADKLENVFPASSDGEPISPYISFATHEDAFNFWSKAPADDIKGLAEFIQLMLNQVAENRENKNWGHKAYDPRFWPDPSELKFRPNGLTLASPPGNKSIGDGVFEFQVGDISGTIDVIGIVDRYLGRLTGITPEAQGVSDENKQATVYLGDLKQVADRFGLMNKSYSEFWAEAGYRYYLGLKVHMPEEMAVKIIGEGGIRWEKIMKKDITPLRDFDIIVESDQADAQADAIKSKDRKDTLMFIEKTPRLAAKMSANYSLEELLKSCGISEEGIKRAMDIQNEGQEDIIAEAAEENQIIYDGKEVHSNTKATTAHLQEHLDFSQIVANKIMDLKGEKTKAKYKKIYLAIITHLKSEVTFAQENSFRAANNILNSLSANAITGNTGNKPVAVEPTPKEGEMKNPQVEGNANAIGETLKESMPLQ
jgi:hypothetical protein